MKSPNPKKLVIGLVFLVLAYIAGSRALDTGSYWEYLGCLVALVLGIKFIVHAVRNHRYGKKD